MAYKIKEKFISEGVKEFNGQNVKTITHKLVLKRKLLAKILGIPNLKSITIITSPDVKMRADWPTLESAPFIGMKIELEDGTQSETMIETIDLP